MAGANEDEEVRKRFRNAHALFASEVYHVIENHIHKREKKDPDFKPNEFLQQAWQYCKAVREFPSKAACDQARELMIRHDLQPTEIAVLGTLVPELPSQAKAYLPSLAEERPSGMTLTDEEIEAMLDELVDLKSMA